MVKIIRSVKLVHLKSAFRDAFERIQRLDDTSHLDLVTTVIERPLLAGYFEATIEILPVRIDGLPVYGIGVSDGRAYVCESFKPLLSRVVLDNWRDATAHDFIPLTQEQRDKLLQTINQIAN